MSTPPFKFFPGQADYLARVACKDFALIAADTGCGKTGFALALLQIKLSNPFTGRALIIAPQATLRDDEDVDNEGSATSLSQWRAEVEKWAPGIPVFEIYSLQDYQAIKRANGGRLPNALYLSYPEALFRNHTIL